MASRDEILNILLLCEQTDYQQAADENGYTPAVLEQLRAVVGEDVLAYGHEMRRILEGSGLAAVYEAREGIPFPAVKNYWPGKFDLSAKMNEQANALDPTTITGERVYFSNLSKQLWDVGGAFRGVKKLYKHHSGDKEMTWEQYFHTIIALLRISGAGFGAFSRSGSEALSSFGLLALSAAAGANVSRAGKDILCTVGLLDRPKKKGSAKSRTKTKAGQRTKRKA